MAGCRLPPALRCAPSQKSPFGNAGRQHGSIRVTGREGSRGSRPEAHTQVLKVESGRLATVSEMLKQSRGAALWISALALMISLVGVTPARQAGAQERGPLTREQARAREHLEEAFTAIADAGEPVVVQI